MISVLKWGCVSNIYIKYKSLCKYTRVIKRKDGVEVNEHYRSNFGDKKISCTMCRM